LRDAIRSIPEGWCSWTGRGYISGTSATPRSTPAPHLFEAGARLADTLRIGVERGDYPDAVGHEEAWLASASEQAAGPERQAARAAAGDGRWLMIEERRTTDGGIIGLRSTSPNSRPRPTR